MGTLAKQRGAKPWRMCGPALEAKRSRADGSPVRPGTVNKYVAAVKSILGFAHRVGFTRFNAAPLIKLKKAAH